MSSHYQLVKFNPKHREELVRLSMHQLRTESLGFGEASYRARRHSIEARKTSSLRPEACRERQYSSEPVFRTNLARAVLGVWYSARFNWPDEI